MKAKKRQYFNLALGLYFTKKSKRYIIKRNINKRFYYEQKILYNHADLLSKRQLAFGTLLYYGLL